MDDDKTPILDDANLSSEKNTCNGDIFSTSGTSIQSYDDQHQDIVQNDDTPLKNDFMNSASAQYGSNLSRSVDPALQSLVPGIQTTPPVSQDQIKIYKRRWYILFIYVLLLLNYSWNWGIWGPLAESSRTAFNIRNHVIAMLTNWGPIAFIVGAFPFSWLMDVKGLRWSVVISLGLIAAGTSLRCINSTPPLCTIFFHIGQVLNGLAGPVAMAAITLVSATWFPLNERTTATAIGTTGLGIGSSFSFILASLVAPPIKNSTANFSESFFVSGIDQSHSDIVALERKYIMNYMYIACGISVFSFLLSLIYFPKQPPLPPCISASVKRVDFKQGIKQLLRHVQFWLIAWSYGLSTGILQSWLAILPVNLSPINIPQDSADWMGFFGTMGGLAASLIVSRFADVFRRNMKKLLLFLYTILLGAFLWLTLMIAKIVLNSYTFVYVAVVLVNVFLSAGYPLFFELSCEMTFPIAEGITTGVLTLMNSVSEIVFLGVLSIPDTNNEWAHWCTVASIAVCIPAFILMRETYGRVEIDEQVLIIDEPNPELSDIASDSERQAVRPLVYKTFKNPLYQILVLQVSRKAIFNPFMSKTATTILCKGLEECPFASQEKTNFEILPSK